MDVNPADLRGTVDKIDNFSVFCQSSKYFCSKTLTGLTDFLIVVNFVKADWRNGCTGGFCSVSEWKPSNRSFTALQTRTAEKQQIFSPPVKRSGPDCTAYQCGGSRANPAAQF